jgi:iron complex transport system substrate-binding protein
MKHFFFIFFLLVSLISCKKEPQSIADGWEKISENVQYKNEDHFLNLNSGKFRYKIPQKKLPFRKVILLNASLVGYFTELGLEDRVIGVSSPEYIYSEKLKELIDHGKSQNIGNEQKYDLEKIIALKPDIIFTNYIASFENAYDLIRKNGIEIIFLDEYLEQNPLDKSKYLLVIGKLFGREKQAALRFREIKNTYDSLKIVARQSPKKPLVLANEMYGNQWFLSGGKSNLAQFIIDANAEYINKDNSDSKAVPLSFEEVFAKAENATHWINVGSHQSKKDLLQINPNYVKMKVYNEGKLFTITGKEKGKANDYFESGVVHADLILMDDIKIFHPELLPGYKLTFLKELK